MTIYENFREQIIEAELIRRIDNVNWAQGTQPSLKELIIYRDKLLDNQTRR